jgi:hypothetical protein
MAVLESPHLETITPQMLNLLAWLGRRKFLRRFYLGGGTALALQLGHRRLVDLVFFSEIDQVHRQTREEIISILAKQNCQVAVPNNPSRYSVTSWYQEVSANAGLCDHGG